MTGSVAENGLEPSKSNMALYKDQIKAQLASAQRMMKQLLPGFQLAASASGPKRDKDNQDNEAHTCDR